MNEKKDAVGNERRIKGRIWKGEQAITEWDRGGVTKVTNVSSIRRCPAKLYSLK